MATLPTTLEPTKHTIERVARELGKQVTLADGLVEGAFGVDQEQFKALLGKTAEQIRDQADVILLSQGSMAYAETIFKRNLWDSGCVQSTVWRSRSPKCIGGKRISV